MRFTSSIDYIRVVHRDLHSSVVEFLDDWFREFFSTSLDYSCCSPIKVGRLFQNHVTTPCGSGVFNFNISESGSYDAMLEFRGALLRTLHPERLREFCQLLHGYEFRCTRLDPCIDDYDKVLDFALVDEALAVKNVKYFDGGNSVTGWGDDAGRTRYFGKRGSSRYGRLYDKSVESRGEMDCYRLEAELKASHAAVAFSNLSVADCGLADWVGMISSVCLGVFDFIDRTADKKIERCPRLSWWEKFCSYFPGHVRYRVHKPTTTIQKTREWFGRSVAKSLATVREAMGKHHFYRWLNSQMNKGYARMNDRDYKKVERYQICRLRELGRWPADLPPHLWNEVNMQELLHKPVATKATT